MRRIVNLVIIVCVLTLGLPRFVVAQVTGGTISGTIRNQVRELVAGAKVTATNTATMNTQQAVSLFMVRLSSSYPIFPIGVDPRTDPNSISPRL